MVTEVYIISDTHFFDQSVLVNLRRPFYGLKDMHSSMIENWNRRVKDSDIVIHLGDYSCKYNQDKLTNITKSLNGYKILVKGNHDIMPDEFYHQIGFNRVSKDIMSVGNYVLSHRPVSKKFLKMNDELVNYHGHSHKHQYGRPYTNFNVDVMGYRPKRVCLWDVKKEMLI